MNYHESQSPVESGDVLKPDGLDDDEWALVRERRAQKAAEEARAAAWAPVFAELNEFADSDASGRPIWSQPGDAWDPAALLFVARAKGAGWDEDRLEDFAIGLVEAAAGFERKEIRNHGTVWVRRCS